jgi:hypothetical protein
MCVAFTARVNWLDSTAPTPARLTNSFDSFAVMRSGRRPERLDLSRLNSFSGEREESTVRFASRGNTSITEAYGSSGAGMNFDESNYKLKK